MPTLLLIRHAENDYVEKGRLAGRLPGIHLNPTGHAQAQTLASHLAQTPLAAVYTSPLERTLETAVPIAEAQHLQPIPRPGLLELDTGDWQAHTLKSLRRLKLWQTVLHRPSLMRFPNGETFLEAQHRIVHELHTLAALHGPKETIACISHSDPIKLALAHFLGLPLDLFQRLHISPASLSTLHLTEATAAIFAINCPPFRPASP